MESSLRTRPSQAPRKVQRAPTKLAKPGAGVTPREKGKGRIDDKIKKRMSTRYAEISSPTQLSGLPPMPAFMNLIPAGEGLDANAYDGVEEAQERDLEREAALAAEEDRKILESTEFDPAAYLKAKLATATEAEVKSLQSSLRGAIDDTSAELQQSVFKNYAEFVLISKEISVLENEMLELKDLLSDYKSMPSSLHIPDPTSASSALMSTYKRSSVADLKVLYFNQMQALHTSIEGAAKFVPTTPGRHVVGEMENVYSLNAATYKVAGKVKFIVLDDAVLVAKRRRRNAAQGTDGSGSTMHEGKLVAEKCWPLSEMLVLDTKDSPSMTNVFKIRHGKETHVYRTESPVDKKNLLAQFRQVAEELSQKRRKEREGEHERRKSMWQGNAAPGSVPPVPGMPDWMAELAKRGGEIPGLGSDAKDKAERDTRWVGEWSDDLTVAIALKEWDKAVDLIEKGQARVAVMPLLASKLPALTSQLVTSLLTSLSLPSCRKTTVISLISLLNRLKAGAAARRTFLDMRTQVIQSLMRKIRFEGHIGTYIGELSVVYFTGIKHTADWYLASFKENEVASAFITWTKQQLEDYAETFRKQVYTKDVDPKIVEEAIAITQSQSKKLLQEYGLDFRYLLDDILLEHPKEQIREESTFSYAKHRISKEDMVIAAARRAPTPPLQEAPPIPIISAAPPPLNPRRPLPAAARAASPPPAIGTNDSLYPPPSSSFKSPNLVSPSTAGSVYSSMRVDPPNSATPPLFSSRQNNYPPSAALNRSRTPVSAAQQSTPMSSSPPVASPLPRSAMGTSSFRSRDRSGSIRDREGSDSPASREWQTRSGRASPLPARSPVPPPPRSANRPGSAMGQRTPVAVPPREGMI